MQATLAMYVAIANRQVLSIKLASVCLRINNNTCTNSVDIAISYPSPIWGAAGEHPGANAFHY